MGKLRVDELESLETGRTLKVDEMAQTFEYAAGVKITSYNQIIRDGSGEFWRVSGTTALPYTLTGTGVDEGGALVSAGDAELRNNLRESSGATLVGYGASTVEGALNSIGSRVSAVESQVKSSESIIDKLKIKMQHGDVVKIACYGDSTTDGFGTTGWTANPTNPDGSAIGAGSHPSAPNAWPKKLEVILQDYYKSTDISVLNAGYSSKYVSDGWALANYDAAIANNPACGNPDILFIQFGTNDSSLALSNTDNFKAQYRLLLDKVIGYGSLPVLLTTDMTLWANSVKASRSIDIAIAELAAEYSLVCVDMGKEMRKWVSTNQDGHTMAGVQPDSLHVGDVGHGFKASLVAKQLLSELVVHVSGAIWINSLDTASGLDKTGGWNIFYGANNHQGGSLYGGPTALGTTIMEIYVWNESASAKVATMGVGNEGGGTPSFSVLNYITGVEASRTMLNGSLREHTLHVPTDVPMVFGRLHYGLNKLRRIAGGGTDSYLGSVMVFDAAQGSNCLRDRGEIELVATPSTGLIINPPVMSNGLNNVASCWGDSVIHIRVGAQLPVGTGVILMSGPVANLTISTPRNAIEYTVLMRKSASSIALQQVTSIDGVLAVVSESVSSGSFAEDTVEWTVEFGQLGAEQVLRVYDSTSFAMLTELVIGATILTPIRHAGYCGGLFADTSLVAAKTTARLDACYITSDGSVGA